MFGVPETLATFGGTRMAKYLFHGSYTQAGIQGVLKDGGTVRQKAVEDLAARIGGSVEAMYWCSGFVSTEVNSALISSLEEYPTARRSVVIGSLRLRSTFTEMRSLFDVSNSSHAPRFGMSFP